MELTYFHQRALCALVKEVYAITNDDPDTTLEEAVNYVASRKLLEAHEKEYLRKAALRL